MRQTKFMVAAVALLIASPTFAESPADDDAKIMRSTPTGSVTVMGLYKQNVYNLSDKKIGQIADVLIGKDGKISAFVISTGAMLGMARHDVVVPFTAVQVAEKYGIQYLTMETTKDELKNAPGFRYDRTTMTWVPDDASRANALSSEGDRNRARRLSGR